MPSATIQSWTKTEPADFLATAATELNGTSLSATYGPPYLKAVTHVKFVAGSPVVPAAADGPVPVMLATAYTMGRSGALDADLLAQRDFYGTNFTRPLLFMGDGAYFSDKATAMHLSGEQWGVMNETGSYPGQPWLWLYTLWYQVPGFSSSPNVDLIAVYLTGLATILLLAIPFIPGLRDIPRWIPVHRLIWRKWEPATAGAGSAGTSPAAKPALPRRGRHPLTPTADLAERNRLTQPNPGECPPRYRRASAKAADAVGTALARSRERRLSLVMRVPAALPSEVSADGRLVSGRPRQGARPRLLGTLVTIESSIRTLHDLTDEEWDRLRGFLPADPRRGGRWADHRTVINGIFFRTRAGCPWRDLPQGFGNWKTVYNRHRRWSLRWHLGEDPGRAAGWLR